MKYFFFFNISSSFFFIYLITPFSIHVLYIFFFICFVIGFYLFYLQNHLLGCSLDFRKDFSLLFLSSKFIVSSARLQLDSIIIILFCLTPFTHPLYMSVTPNRHSIILFTIYFLAKFIHLYATFFTSFVFSFLSEVFRIRGQLKHEEVYFPLQ